MVADRFVGCDMEEKPDVKVCRLGRLFDPSEAIATQMSQLSEIIPFCAPNTRKWAKLGPKHEEFLLHGKADGLYIAELPNEKH